MDPKTLRKKELIKKQFSVFFNILEGFDHQNLTLVLVKPRLIVKRFGA